MKLGMYSFFDRKARSFGEPFLAARKEVAVRRFQYVIGQSPMVKADMELYVLGEFESDTGEIVPGVDFITEYEESDENEKK